MLEFEESDAIEIGYDFQGGVHCNDTSAHQS